MNRILIIIPAYNEAKNIEWVILSVREEVPHSDILVINDGSADDTSRIAKEFGVKVIDLPYNLGIGAAMQTGFMYAERKGYEVAVQVDGDGQHPSKQISFLTKSIFEGKADVTIGSRFLGEGDYSPSLARSVGIRIFSLILSLITRQRVTDPTSGFRAINREAITFLAGYYPEDYPEVEAIVLLRKAGFKITEVPVTMKARVWGKSSITYPRAFYYMVKVLLSVLIDLIKKVER